MEEDPSNDVIYLMEIGTLDYLGPIRHWGQLKIAASPQGYWVSGLTADLLESVEIRSIPFKRLYYMRGKDPQLLFPYGGAVPVKRLPSPLLWQPLEKAIPLDRPSYNHNYFGLSEQLSVRLVPSGHEEEPMALLVLVMELGNYLETAPAIRLEALSWVIIDDQALVIGRPLLPLRGMSYWQRGNHLLPAGLDMEWSALAGTLDRVLNPDGDCWLLWDEDGSYFSVKKETCRPLSISSYRLSTGIANI